MIRCIISNFVANKIEKDSIFIWSLSRQGFKIDDGIEQSILESVKTKDVMITDILVFKETNTFAEIKKSIESRTYAYFPVVDDNGFLKGVISLNDISERVLEGAD